MHIHLDLLGGLAGDMFLAGAIDAGLVDIAALERALRTIGLGTQIKIVTQRVMRGAISGTHVRFEGWDPQAEADHRHLSTILEMLDESGLEEGVRERAKAMFNLLGEAEAAIHGMPLERVHFHEVGAVDSLLDFVSAAWIIERVAQNGAATWSISDVPAGSGTIETDHGTIPVPAPATLRLLEGFSIVYRDARTEFVTPTGAAILRTLRPDFAPARGRCIESGFGCGTRDLAQISNVVRFVVLEDDAQTRSGLFLDHDTVGRIATEIDDMNPEILAYLEQALLERGALDVVREAVFMKKGRQGIRLTVLTLPEQRDALADYIFMNTSTFGVRVDTVERLKLRRTIEVVEIPFGPVRVKVGYRVGVPGQGKDAFLKASPEFEDCARLASQHNVPLEEVYQLARQAALEEFG